MAGLGSVTIAVSDGGSGFVTVPVQSVQVVIGTASGGTAVAGTQIVSTRSLTTLTSAFGVGPLVEAAALAIQAGGTVLCIQSTTQTAGTQRAVQFTGTGSSVITTSGAARDTYYVVFKVITGGTQGSTGCTFQISLDGGRQFGPNIVLGTAVSYAIPGTGITLNFGAGTFVAGDVAKFATTEPITSVANYQTCLTTLQNSVYAQTGWGSMHLCSGTAVTSTMANVPGADCTSLQTTIDNMATNASIYTRAFMFARDAISPTAWGGAGETEATWTAALLADYASVSAKRMCVGAAHWNVASAYPNATAWGAPRYRRPMTYAAAARQVQLAPQRMLSRVKSGPLSQIVVDSVNDPLDGFVYHDERSNPGLSYVAAGGSGGRFMSTRTWPRTIGTFATSPLTMAPLGSDFFILPRGNVMDVACSIVYSQALQLIDDDVRLNPNGTLNADDAQSIQNDIQGYINAQMLAAGMLSPPGAQVVVDTAANVGLTNIVPINVTIFGKGYVLGETVNIQYNNPLVAAGSQTS